ncbi:DUF2785 domain-containing protein [Paenibacillus herberti]|uniref:DUF2785 domain-containing protein n=1 Tax=Paenibacillus herberti TaxID=1619309 RepID=UPI001FE497B6|nr:DUF2785 domain-containing protein [Paenibacillus herberti]
MGNDWAHGAAHGADALDEIVQCEECTAEIHKEVLSAIQKVLFNGTYTRVNVKHFLRSLYFRIKCSPDEYSGLLEIVHKTENGLNKFM